MDSDFRKRNSIADHRASHPTEAWLFAQRLLGNCVSSVSADEADARRKRELLEWVARISTKHEDDLRRLHLQEAENARNREILEWAAKISTRCERKLHALQAVEAEEREARQALLRHVEHTDISEAEWDPARHPRGGYSDNRGKFSPGWGTGLAGGANVPSGPAQFAVYDPDRTPVRIEKLSGKGKSPHQSNMGATGATTPPITKPHLPADHRGSWIKGTKGHGTFRFNDIAENKRAGVAGKEFRFEGQNIAVGGFPSEAYYGGNAKSASVKIKHLTGFEADSRAADAQMRIKLGNPNWKRPSGHVWNHAGQRGSNTMELVHEEYHRALAHKGPVAEIRAAARGSRVRGSTGRAIAVLTVYLTARDSLRAAGLLQPEYEVASRETYHFIADDGSIFIVMIGLFRTPRIEFVAGPRKGEIHFITSKDVNSYRTQAEKIWGKYIHGTIFSEPRFIPGTKRKSLPLFKYQDGIPYEAGWIDEKGVHEYPPSRPLLYA